jgi:hypothetical protein
MFEMILLPVGVVLGFVGVFFLFKGKTLPSLPVPPEVPVIPEPLKHQKEYATLKDGVASYIEKAEAFKAVRKELNIPEHIQYMTEEEAFLQSKGARRLQDLQINPNMWMERNAVTVAELVGEFVRGRIGSEFTAGELRNYVTNRIGGIAPGTTDRILRRLRAQYKINYLLLSRKESRYRSVPVERPEPESVPDATGTP